MRIAWLGAAIVAAGLFCLAPAALAADPVTKVDAALQNVLRLDRPGKDGYATVWDGDKFVQCGRALPDGLRCEAAGMRMQPSLADILTPPRLKRLGDLGWEIDPHFGAYVQVFPASITTRQVAEAIVTTLHDAYGADVSNLATRTAWLASEPCPPRNGYTQNLAGMINDAPEMARYAVHACFFLPPPAPVQPVVATVDGLVGVYGARVAAEIQRLRVNLDERGFAVFQAGIGYVQCSPETEPDVIYCEAQSAKSWAALGAILTPERIARLHAAGYADPGRAPNYWKSYPVDKYDDATIAREILALLHDVYGYDGSERLKIGTEAGDEK